MEIDQAILILKQVERVDKSLDRQETVAEAILELCNYWRTDFEGVAMSGALGGPDWTTYERKIWEAGESLRLFMKPKRWSGKGPLLDGAARILLCRNYGKGRQTYALLLGDFGRGNYGEEVSSVLDDREVCGHAVAALTKAKIFGYAEQVGPLATHKVAWIRNAAKRYLKAAEGWAKTDRH